MFCLHRQHSQAEAEEPETLQAVQVIDWERSMGEEERLFHHRHQWREQALETVAGVGSRRLAVAVGTLWDLLPRAGERVAMAVGAATAGLAEERAPVRVVVTP